MKRTLLLLSVGAFLCGPALAQTQGGAGAHPKDSPPASVKPHDLNGGAPSPEGRMGAGLSPEEREELRTARQAALQDNPKLAEEMKAVQDKINAAMIKADPKVAPLIAKMEAARQQHREGGDHPERPSGPGVSGSKGDKPPAPGN